MLRLETEIDLSGIWSTSAEAFSSSSFVIVKNIANRARNSSSKRSHRLDREFQPIMQFTIAHLNACPEDRLVITKSAEFS